MKNLLQKLNYVMTHCLLWSKVEIFICDCDSAVYKENECKNFERKWVKNEATNADLPCYHRRLGVCNNDWHEFLDFYQKTGNRNIIVL